MNDTKQLRAVLAIPGVDDKYTLWIGKVIIAWAYLETAFNDFTHRLLVATSTEPDKNWRTQKMEKRLERFTDLSAKAFVEHERIDRHLRKIRDEIEATQVDRNLFAHGEIGTKFPKTGGISGISIAGRNVTREYTLKDIQELATALYQLTGRFEAFVHPELDETFWPGWSPQELSALRDFRSRSRLTPPKPSMPQPPPR